MQFIIDKSKDMYLTESYKNFSLTPGIKLRLIPSQAENHTTNLHCSVCSTKPQSFAKC